MKTSDGGANIRLWKIEQDDLPRLYEYQLDPDANQLSLTHPRSSDAFDSHIVGHQHSPGDDRYQECEEVILELEEDNHE